MNGIKSHIDELNGINPIIIEDLKRFGFTLGEILLVIDLSQQMAKNEFFYNTLLLI